MTGFSSSFGGVGLRLHQFISAAAGLLELALLDQFLPHGRRKLVWRRDGHDARPAVAQRPAADFDSLSSCVSRKRLRNAFERCFSSCGVGVPPAEAFSAGGMASSKVGDIILFISEPAWIFPGGAYSLSSAVELDSYYSGQKEPRSKNHGLHG